MDTSPPAPPPIARASSRISNDRRLNGTRCTRFPFVRRAGMVHTPSSRSISFQTAPRTSPERVAVRTKNSNVSFTTDRVFDARTAWSADATSPWAAPACVARRSPAHRAPDRSGRMGCRTGDPSPRPTPGSGGCAGAASGRWAPSLAGGLFPESVGENVVLGAFSRIEK